MLRKLIPFFLCLLVLIAGGLAFTGRKPQAQHPPTHPSPRTDTPVPEYVVYNFLFRGITTYKKRAEEKGHPQARNRSFQKEAGLTDDQYGKLDEIAAATLQEVDRQDARAKEIISAFRARYPGGVVPRGEKLPEPPPELLAMQEERNAMLLRGRDRLRAALGEQMFAHFHEFALKRFAGKGSMKSEVR
jgi:hypothetical protein